MENLAVRRPAVGCSAWLGLFYFDISENFVVNPAIIEYWLDVYLQVSSPDRNSPVFMRMDVMELGCLAVVCLLDADIDPIIFAYTYAEQANLD